MFLLTFLKTEKVKVVQTQQIKHKFKWWTATTTVKNKAQPNNFVDGKVVTTCHEWKQQNTFSLWLLANWNKE